MEVILAKTSGFCFGVKRAVDTVYEQTEKSKKIYTYGPIIHNEQVVKDLEEKGVEVIESKEELALVFKFVKEYCSKTVLAELSDNYLSLLK